MDPAQNLRRKPIDQQSLPAVYGDREKEIDWEGKDLFALISRFFSVGNHIIYCYAV